MKVEQDRIGPNQTYHVHVGLRTYMWRKASASWNQIPTKQTRAAQQGNQIPTKQTRQLSREKGAGGGKRHVMRWNVLAR